MDLYNHYRGLERRCKTCLKQKKRSYWPRYIKNLKLFTLLTELQSLAKRMRNSKASNESERVPGVWLEPFAQKVSPDFDQAHPFKQCAHGSDPHMNSPFTKLSLALHSSNNSSPGLDQIRDKLLRNLPVMARKRLLRLFNIMFMFMFMFICLSMDNNALSNHFSNVLQWVLYNPKMNQLLPHRQGHTRINKC